MSSRSGWLADCGQVYARAPGGETLGGMFGGMSRVPLRYGWSCPTAGRQQASSHHALDDTFVVFPPPCNRSSQDERLHALSHASWELSVKSTEHLYSVSVRTLG